VGITPNLTTSGLGLDEQAAARCAIFGQINVSVDGVGEAYRSARGFDGYRHAERALRLLRALKREVGVNCVVSRSSFEHVGEVAALVRRLDLNELELLRFKPVGRGARLGEELTPEQGKRLWPMARRLRGWPLRCRSRLGPAAAAHAHRRCRRRDALVRRARRRLYLSRLLAAV
jgi:MoaA/NifB/PqqE/SkfB family radical SAM enzyme